jgi:hypothetical protein
VVRISGGTLLRERGESTTAVTIAGRSLRELAVIAGTDIDADFSVGSDTPDPGDVDRPLELDMDAVSLLAVWWNLGTVVLDSVLGGLPPDRDPATIQLWPEHFDVATVCMVADGSKVNLGFSPGDSYQAGPYAYVGPWDDARPHDPMFWNAPFGAAKSSDVLLDVDDPFGAARGFLGHGLTLLGVDLAPSV